MDIKAMRNEILVKETSIKKQEQEITKNLSYYFIHPDTLASAFERYNLKNSTTFEEIGKVNYNRALRNTQSFSQQILASKSNIDHFNREINKYEVEVHKKFSIPFACLVFVLIGAPLGIKARKGSFGVGFTFSVGFFLIYWICLIGGEELADRQIVIPSLAMWFPNIVVGTLGVLMTFKTLKETTFIRWEKMPKFLQFLLKENKN
jgi:lipopolysaccharide export system permease protein